MRRRPPRRAVVTCVSGRTIVGELTWSWPGWVRIRAARVAERGVDPGTVPAADGIVYVRSSSIDFMQVI